MFPNILNNTKATDARINPDILIYLNYQKNSHQTALAKCYFMIENDCIFDVEHNLKLSLFLAAVGGGQGQEGGGGGLA
jgi:hypothetical protein